MNSQLEFLTELVNSHIEIAGDVLQIGLTTWAIHGSIPVDGDVLVAEYDSLESAKAALAQLPPSRATDLHGHRGESAGPRAYFLGRDSATWRAALPPRLCLAGSRP
jgi:hypothetical protein